MIKLENFEVVGWEHAIRGMRNPKNSWKSSDSLECIYSCDDCENFSICQSNDGAYFKDFWENGCYGKDYAIGPKDHKLMMNLRNAGTDHRKYMRMITVYLDITAPFYWWKEFDTYKVGTVANSCSTMHKIADKEFTLDDFSTEHLFDEDSFGVQVYSLDVFRQIIESLNIAREAYNATNDKRYWWQMIQLLPTSYNQKRTIMLNYEVLANMYKSRRAHKLDEWRFFCEWIESLPYSEIITGKLLGKLEVE